MAHLTTLRAPAGAVLFDFRAMLRSGGHRPDASPRLAAQWSRDTDGRLVRRWRGPGKTPAPSARKLQFEGCAHGSR